MCEQLGFSFFGQSVLFLGEISVYLWQTGYQENRDISRWPEDGSAPAHIWHALQNPRISCESVTLTCTLTTASPVATTVA